MARMNRLLFFARLELVVVAVPSRASRRSSRPAPLLTPLGASRASFLTSLCSPGSPFLTALCRQTCRIRGRRRGRSGRVGFGLPPGTPSELKTKRQVQRRRASKKRECATTTDLFRLCSFTHFQAPVCCPVKECHYRREPSYSSGSTWPPGSSHARTSTDGIETLGRWGMMVPAVTISPSLNFSRAKADTRRDGAPVWRAVRYRSPFHHCGGDADNLCRPHRYFS